MSETAKWYVIHTYSGYENKVAQDIEKVVENRKLHDMILEVRVPTEKVTEITDGKIREVERKTFPSYVLLKMIYTDDTWHVVKNIRGVTGFVGPGSEPTPLSEQEVQALGVDLGTTIEVNYAVGDTIMISGTAMDGFVGVVQNINMEEGTVDVLVSMFGKETPATVALNLLVSAPAVYHIMEVCNMAQKVTGYIKLQIPAGKATPAPPVGPALGQHGVNIMAFTKEFNERTKNDIGMIIPVVITVYADRSFTFITKTPPAAVLLKKACGLETASGVPNKTKVANITKEQIQQIAEHKMPDLNAGSLEAAMSMIAGTARSMGIVVVD